MVDTESYREILALTRTSDEFKTTRCGPWLMLQKCLMFLVVLIWCPSALSYLHAWLLSFQQAVSGHSIFSFKDGVVVLISAAIFTFAAIMHRDLLDVSRWLWLPFERFVGRFVVLSTGVIDNSLLKRTKLARRSLAFVGVAMNIAAILLALKGAVVFYHAPRLLSSPLRSALNEAQDPKIWLFFFFAALATTLSWLLIRFCFSDAWRHVYRRPRTVLLTKRVVRSQNGSRVKIVHLSDLHITDDECTCLVEKNGQFVTDEQLLKLFSAMGREAHQCDGFLLTGDITDQGSLKAWERFLDELPENVNDKVILVPGNHDLNLQDPWLFLRAEMTSRVGQRLRRVRAMCVMAYLMGKRAELLDVSTNRVITLSEYFSKHEESIRALALPDAGQSNVSIDKLWEGMFPLVVTVGSAPSSVGFVLFDSVKPGSIGFTNAIGAIRATEITRARDLMNRVANDIPAFTFALHHHVALPPAGTRYRRVQGAGMILENAGELTEMLAERGEPTVVFHGHRHIAFTGVVENSKIHIVASPSATLGDEAKHRDSESIDLRSLQVNLEVSRGTCQAVPNAVIPLTDLKRTEEAVAS